MLPGRFISFHLSIIICDSIYDQTSALEIIENFPQISCRMANKRSHQYGGSDHWTELEFMILIHQSLTVFVSNASNLKKKTVSGKYCIVEKQNFPEPISVQMDTRHCIPNEIFLI